MAGRLSGKTAVVTGASSGIGEATVLALAAEGAAVAVPDRRTDRVEALARCITESGGTGVAVPDSAVRRGGLQYQQVGL